MTMKEFCDNIIANATAPTKMEPVPLFRSAVRDSEDRDIKTQIWLVDNPVILEEIEKRYVYKEETVLDFANDIDGFIAANTTDDRHSPYYHREFLDFNTGEAFGDFKNYSGTVDSTALFDIGIGDRVLVCTDKKDVIHVNKVIGFSYRNRCVIFKDVK